MPVPDESLLGAVARLWEVADPPPVDLADGVLARLAAEDPELDWQLGWELELLTLVEHDALAGVRHAAPEGDEAGTWALEYAGPDFRAYLRLTRIEDRTRLDGWVVPARPMTVELTQLTAAGEDGASVSVGLDEFGRFAFAEAGSGAHRLAFLDRTPSAPAGRPRVTPPFWI